ncbi:MAG: trigger factor [Candidatus Nanopelagicales bacterium]
MKSTVEKVSETRIKLQVEIPFGDLKPNLDSAYKKIAAQISIPGFRKGKVPPAIIDQRVGRPAVLEEAINEMVPKAYAEAVKENKLFPVGRPEVDVNEVLDNEKVSFTAEVDIRPEFDLPNYDGISLAVDEIVVTDKDIDEELKALLSRFATLSDVERQSKFDDVLILDIAGTIDGEEVPGYSGKGLSYQLGTDGLVPGADKLLTGKKTGEAVAHEFKPEEGPHQGKAVSLQMQVVAVKERILPAADDDFAKLASEFDTLDELKADLNKRVEQAKLIEVTYQARDKAVEYLVDAIKDVPLPENVVKAEIAGHFTDGHGDETHKAEVEENTRKSLRTQFVFDRIAEEAEIEVSDAELSSWIYQNAARYQMPPQEFANNLARSGELTFAVSEVRRGKAVSLVVQKAEIVDSKGNKIDISKTTEPVDE